MAIHRRRNIGLSDCPTRAGCLFGKPTQNGSHERDLKGLRPWEKVAVSRSREVESTTWKTLERHFAFYLPPYHRSPIKIAAKGTYSTFRHRLEEKERKEIYMYIYTYVYPPFYDEFAYEMKECPPRIEDRIHISTRKRVSHFFSPPDAYASSSIFACNEWPLVPVHTSEFLIPKMHQERYEP